MLKKYSIVIFIILCFISTKELFLKKHINDNYMEISQQFKSEYESNEKLSLESLYKYKEFLYENEIDTDEFIIDTYIKHLDNVISKDEEENIKNSIDESKYLISKILGGELLCKYYLENNEDGEAENLIIDIFNQLKRKQFENNTDEIIYFLKMVKHRTKDKDDAIKILEELIESKNITDIIKLEIYEELRFLYIYNNNYALASEVAVKSLIISSEKNLQEDMAEGLIELALLFKRLGGVESGIELIEKSLFIEIEDEFKNADLKTYALLTLAELYLVKEDYHNAKLTLEQIPNYKDSIPIDIYRDIEIIKLNMDSRIAVYEGDLNLAEEYLNYSKQLQEIDEEEYYFEKDISYLLALGNFYEASKQYENAINLYEKMLSENKNNKYLIEQILEGLTKVENDSNKKSYYHNKLLELKIKEEEERYGDYTFYILDKINHEKELIEKNKAIENTYKLNIILTLLAGLIIGILFNRIKSIKIKNKKDVLVDAYNRRYFDTTYKRLLSKNKIFSIIIIDLDNFKSINDNFGHELGDTVLINICKAIKSLLSEDSFLFRYGGEEFVIIVKNKSIKEVLQLAESIRAKVESLNWQEDIVTTISMGVAYSEKQGRDTLKKADENLYISKNTGKNKITYK